MTDTFFAIPWRQMLLPELSWAEKLVRPLLVYLVLLLIFRLANKREMASATVFDFLIVLMISNVVQNAMIGSDNSVLGKAEEEQTVWKSLRDDAATLLLYRFAALKPVDPLAPVTTPPVTR